MVKEGFRIKIGHSTNRHLLKVYSRPRAIMDPENKTKALPFCLAEKEKVTSDCSIM